MTNALLVIDAQNDFMYGGTLAIPNSNTIIPVINNITGKFNRHIWTQDWHPKNHCSFIENGGLWPVHCVAKTEGAKIHADLNFDTDDAYIHKGTLVNSDSYSPFNYEGKTRFSRYLTLEDIHTLFVCGLAIEYCVKITVLDALKAGFKVVVVTDGVHGLTLKDSEIALKEMIDAGALFINSEDIQDQT